MPIRFPFLRYPLRPFSSIAETLPDNSSTKLRKHLGEARYSVRLLRYWWAGQALAEESRRLGRPLQVVDLGCERGWLKHFTPEGVVERWIGLDWNPQAEVTKLARYDEVMHANFDEHLPLPNGCADAVVSLHVFEHLLRPGNTIAEVSRLLKPGGIFLGGSPTMPQCLATMREKYCRRRLKEGKIAPGGHISVLSPSRWASLARDVGLQVEFVTGSHAIRRTGSPLENSRLWVRMNQVWGALFPSLGSECYLMARRDAVSMAAQGRLAPEDPHRRGLWISTAVAACVALVGGVFFAVDQVNDRYHNRIAGWLDAHQDGEDKFIVWDTKLHAFCEDRADVLCAKSLNSLKQLIQKHEGAHLLVSIHGAVTLSKTYPNANWKIDSRLDFNGTDYLLLRHEDQGTKLIEYLLGAN